MIMVLAALVVLVLAELLALLALVDLVVFRVALVRVLVNLAALMHLPAHQRQTLQQHSQGRHSHNRRHRVRKGQHHQ